ncbi:MAG: succinate dehydrogenase assembly factor 2 [Candidatus Marinimicrobia bacterium]|nr:succinate dehydrogenase assembly factor 2 [Candidatus Neomarinimicrobiota bacterium]|tara:strand:- start:533 stop:793 length:261 start_codon:yes stop_codon:yes gene_type:complete
MDFRRKRIIYRANHRGTKECDTVIGGFFTSIIIDLPDSKLEEAEQLLDVDDADLMDWFVGRKPVPDRWKNSLFDGILRHYRSLKER